MRYRTFRPRKSDDWYEEEKGVTASCVIEAVQDWQETGLYDHHGEPLYRAPDVAPIGFDLSRRVKM